MLANMTLMPQSLLRNILVCEEHKETDENKALLEEYRRRCITRRCNDALPDFAKTIHLAFHCTRIEVLDVYVAKNESEESGIYMFQWIRVNDEHFLVFYDSGCKDLLLTNDARIRLGRNAKKIYDGTVSVGGVSGCSVESPHGACEISLPLHNGRNAVMSGIVIDKITEEFPTYVLNTDVEKDIQNEYIQSGGNVADLPRLPHSVGQHVDIMIGAATYNRYFPTEVFRTSSGLSLCTSLFKNLDGSRGVVVGPHKSFTAIENNFFSQRQRSQAFVLTHDAMMFKLSYQNEKNFLDTNFEELSCDVSEEGFVCDHDCTCALISRTQKTFDQVESAGNEITYRCVESVSVETVKVVKLEKELK